MKDLDDDLAEEILEDEENVNEDEAADQPEDETPSEETDVADDEAGEDEGREEEGDDLVLTFGDDEEPGIKSEETPVFQDLRKKLREANKRIKSLEKASGGNEAPKLRAKPTLKDHSYKDAEYEADLEKWYDEKQEHDQAQRSQEAKADEQKKQYQARLDGYQKGRIELGVSDFEEVEDTVKVALSGVQQSILVSVCKDSAKFVYALGKNDLRLSELSQIDDPVQFAAEVGRLETNMKTSRRKAAPPPEKRLRGSGPAPGTGDQTLKKLEAEADKTGDRTKLLAYKRKLKQGK